MYATIVEGIGALAEELAIELPAIQPRVCSPRHEIQLRGFQPPRDLLELAHPAHVLVAIFRVMRQVAGKEHQLGRLRSRVEQIDRVFKRLGAERVGWRG